MIDPFAGLRQATLQVAKRELGRREATGHNDGAFVRMLQRWAAAGARFLDGAPWCCCFATWCIHQAGRQLGVPVRVPACASSSALYRWYRREGLLLGAPIPGCVAMLRGGRTGHEHTCLVHAVENGQVITVDGNWRNAVSWAKHPIAGCDFGRIV